MVDNYYSNNKMKKKFNQELLNEELKKFKLISEYSFYTGENDLAKPKDNLILGDLDEADDTPDDLEPVDDIETATDDVAKDLGVDDENGDMSGEIGDTSSDDVETAPEPEVAPLPEPEAPAGDEVEVDVTSLVKGSEDAKASADMASQNTQQLLQKFSELEGRVAAMDSITNKIEDLEKEIIKRSPTPVEKLEMRSLNSFPYSLKLTDYWAEKEGSYDVTGEKSKAKEYILTKDDVDSGYSDSQIKQSMNPNTDDENSFEEEDI